MRRALQLLFLALCLGCGDGDDLTTASATFRNSISIEVDSSTLIDYLEEDLCQAHIHSYSSFLIPGINSNYIITYGQTFLLEEDRGDGRIGILLTGHFDDSDVGSSPTDMAKKVIANDEVRDDFNVYVEFILRLDGKEYRNISIDRIESAVIWKNGDADKVKFLRIASSELACVDLFEVLLFEYSGTDLLYSRDRTDSLKLDLADFSISVPMRE